MYLVFIVLNILTISYAQPYGISPKNVITVPPNCPPGQEWINGACRDIWFRSVMTPAPLKGIIPAFRIMNFIIVPRNVPEKQKHGSSRELLRMGSVAKIPEIAPANMVTVPSNCPPGQQYINGQCRDVWRGGDLPKIPEIAPVNMVTVPSNCPPGQQYINGQCRDVWRGGDLANSLFFNQLLQKLWSDYIGKIKQTKTGLEENSNVIVNDSPRHIINVPNQCPIGFRPDALGICRPIL